MSGARSIWVRALGLAALGIAVAAVLAYLVTAKDPSVAGTVVAAVVAVIAVAVPTAAWLWRSESGLSAAMLLTATADELASVVASQWEQAANERGLLHPVPIPLRWRWSDRSVAGPMTVSLRDDARIERFAPLPGTTVVDSAMLRQGGLMDLYSIYGGLDSGRMVILGPPGAGKSGAVILLMLDALARRRRMSDVDRALVPVPVLLTLTGWDPNTEPVSDWLAKRLRTDYPFLTAVATGRSTPSRLVRDGRVALFLDGLDEVPLALRPAVFRALNTQVTFRLVLLSRSMELTVAARGGHHLQGAAALELQTVSGTDAADYLSNCQTQPLAEGWQRFVEHIRSCPESAVTQALDSPLMLSLVRATISTTAEIDDLLDSSRHPTRREVENTLLGRVIPVAYGNEPGRADPPYTAIQAQRWLGYLAHQMNVESSRDLAWWQVPRWRPAFSRAFASTLLVGFPAGMVVSVAFGLNTGLASGVASGLAIGVTGGRNRRRRPEQLGRITWNLGRINRNEIVSRRSTAFGLTFGLVIGLEFWLAAGPAFGTAIGGLAGLVSGLLVGVTRSSAEVDSPIDPLTCWKRDRRLGLAFGVGAMVGLGVLVGVLGLVHGRRLVLVLGLTPLVGLAFGLVYSETWPATLAFIQLRNAGLGPARMLRFLSDAHSRLVLRTTGPLYQFRHARLQDWLAQEFEKPSQADRPRQRAPRRVSPPGDHLFPDIMSERSMTDPEASPAEPPASP